MNGLQVRFNQLLSSQRGEILAIVLILSLALFLRFYKLGTQMPFTWDQGRDMWDLTQIAHGKLMLTGPTTGFQGVFLGPFYYYFLLPGFLMGQGSPVIIQYWETFLITASLLLGYLILKELTAHKWLALLGLLMLTLVPGALMEARMIWNPSIAAPVLLLGIYTLFKSLKKPWLLPISFLCLGLSWQTELAYTLFLTPAWFYWLFKYRFVTPKYSWKIIIISLLTLGLTLAPQGLFELRHDFIMTKSLQRDLKETSGQVSLTQVWQSRPTAIAQTLQNRLFAQPNSSYGLILFVATLCFLFWIMASKNKDNREKFVILLTLLPIAAMMINTANGGNFFDYYLSPHYLPIILLLIIGLNKLSRLPQLLITALILVVLGSATAQMVIMTHQDEFGYTLDHQLKALMYAREHRSTDNYAVEVFVPNLLPSNYEYLNQWLAQSGQATPADFYRGGQHDEYFLIWEPAFAGASAMEYDKWRARHTTDADCQVEHHEGIITIERCHPLRQ